MTAGHDPLALDVLVAARLSSHVVNHEDGDRSIVMHTNEQAADRAIAALTDAGLVVVRGNADPPRCWCMTGWDLGLAEYGDMIAESHPECPAHS